MPEETVNTKSEKKFIKVDRDELSKNLGEVLVVDDNGIYTDLISRNLTSVGFESKSINSFVQMESILEEKHYPLILCDNIDDKSTLKGSEIILNNNHLFKDSRTVLVTGHPLSQIKDQNELLKRGVIVLQKGEGHVDEIIKICRETFTNKVEAIAQEAEDYVGKLLLNYKDMPKLDNPTPYEKLIKRTRLRFKDYISKLPNPDSPQFFIKGKGLSPNQVMFEIEKDDSEIGVLLIDILLEDILEGEIYD